MKFSLLLALFLSVSSLFGAEIEQANTTENVVAYEANTNVTPIPSQRETQNCSSQKFLARNSCIRVSVLGQGVAPTNTASPAQAFALAKRAAIADSYRLIAEKVKGVNVDGHDLIKNMMVKRSTIRTAVNALVQNANITETVFKDGLCEVEMEILVYHSQFN